MTARHDPSHPEQHLRSSAIGVGKARHPAAPLEQSVAWWLFFALLFVGAVVLILGPSSTGDDNAGTEVEGRTLDRAGLAADADPPTTAAAGADTATGFTLVAGGDVLIHESVAESAATDAGFDFGPQLAAVAPMIRSADVAICHLEVPISATNDDLAYYPAFRVPNQLAPALAEAGFDSCSVASNHSLDAGEAGVISTLDQLDLAGVAHAGTARSAAEAEQVTLLEAAPGVLVAHLSYTYGFNGTDVPAEKPWLANRIDTERILDDAAGARTAGADFVVVSLHWGLEYQFELTDQQRDVAPAVLASPAVDLVIGHHAHVMQPVERLGDEYVAYGLGNFISNQSPDTCDCPIGVEDGVLLEFDVVADENGRFVVDAVRANPTWVDRTGGHVVLPTEADPPPGGVDPATLAASSERTRAALGAQVE